MSVYRVIYLSGRWHTQVCQVGLSFINSTRKRMFDNWRDESVVRLRRTSGNHEGHITFPSLPHQSSQSPPPYGDCTSSDRARYGRMHERRTLRLRNLLGVELSSSTNRPLCSNGQFISIITSIKWQQRTCRSYMSLEIAADVIEQVRRAVGSRYRGSHMGKS